MAKLDALTQLKFRRQQMAERKKLPNRGKRLPKWLHPIPVEIEYNRMLQKYVNAMSDVVETVLVPAIPSLLEQRNLEIPEAARSDAWPEDAARLMGTVRQGFNTIPVNMPANISEIANRTNVWNDKEWRKILEATFGVDIFQREPWLNETLNSWSKENAALITKMSDDYVSQVEGIVQRGVRGGVSHKKLKTEVMERTGVTKNRAKLIARDQVSKLNGQLTELRQTNLGVRKYIWRDSDDARVRQTHRDNDGKTFSWNKAPLATGHPGWDYQCRCWAEPIFNEIMDELGIEKAPEPVTEPRPAVVTKKFKTKASAQSARSRAGLTGKADIIFNPATNKWEMKVPTGVRPRPRPKPKAPTVKRPEGTVWGNYASKASAQSTISRQKLTKQGATIFLNPETKRWEVILPPPKQTYVTKFYGSKASAQSAKSRGKHKKATIAYNSNKGKWELKIPVGAVPEPTVAKIPKGKAILDPSGRPLLKDPTTGKVRDEMAIVRDVRETGMLPKELEETVRKYEDKIRFNSYESGSYIPVNKLSMKGNYTQHSPDGVSIPGIHVNKVVTHNHPGYPVTTHSNADIANSHNRYRLQMRAANRDRVYILTRKGPEWFTKEDLKKYYNGSLNVFKQKYQDGTNHAFMMGKARAERIRRDKGWSYYSDLHKKEIDNQITKQLEERTREFAKRHDWHFQIVHRPSK